MTGPGRARSDLSPLVSDWLACVTCARHFQLTGRPSVPAGWCRRTGWQVFVCAGSCADHARPHIPGQHQNQHRTIIEKEERR